MFPPGVGGFGVDDGQGFGLEGHAWRGGWEKTSQAAWEEAA